MRLDFGRDLVTRSGRAVVGSGRYLVAGSQVPGTRKVGGGRGVSSSGRQAADNNQAWTAGRRMQDCRAQSAEM